jgi:hypothetical protein
MPGATQVHLRAGDFAMYRNSLWHIGSYVPYVKRATLHDIIDTPTMDEWVNTNVPTHFKSTTAERATANQAKTSANAHGISTATGIGDAEPKARL